MSANLVSILMGGVFHAAILFLVSDKARFITGQNLGVDGGWWMH